MIARLLGCLALSFFALQPTFAQETADSTALPNIYIECDRCDRSFQRRQLNFMNHVRDQADADVYLQITSRFTAARGVNYRLQFEGLNEFAGLSHSLEHTSLQAETDNERRAGLMQVIKMGLMPFLAQTDIHKQFSIDYEEAGSTSRVGLGQDDPWNSWVFNFSVGGNAGAEESQERFGLDIGGGATRITEAFKIDTDFDVDLNQQNFDSDDGTIRSTSRRINAEVDLVKSISDHWSYGLLSEYDQSTFTNLKASFAFNPAIEYNLYPWSESDLRAVTIAYFVGARRVTYFDETIFDKLQETLLSQSIRIQAEYEQPWGEVFASLTGSHYFHDFSKNRLELFSFMDIRITKGLTLFLAGGASLIHDQLFLKKGDASLEEVLLRQRRLATDFEVSGRIGLRITFGSIYNNVVNQRL